MSLLSELKIRCEFFDRGCGKFVQLGDLERHVADCGFAPAVCSNEGCQLEVNKQDLLHHETAVCELRRVKCHSCNDIKREMDTMNDNLAAIHKKLDGNEKSLSEKIETSRNAAGDVAAKVQLVQAQLNKQEENNRQLKADNVHVEMKKSLNEIMKQLERMTQQTLHEVQAEEMKKGIAEATDEMVRDPNVVVAGGDRNNSNSVEMFSLATGIWTQLQPMGKQRTGASSVVYENQLFVIGGRESKTMEKFPLVHDDQFQPWENIHTELPERLDGHCTVIYNGRLIVIGGYTVEIRVYSNSITGTEISLVLPYTSKLLATMPNRRCRHNVAIFGDKILIVGGGRSMFIISALRSVVMYDITNNEWQELAPLPYPVRGMATVKWGDDNVMIMGGVDSDGKSLNQVLMYNIKTQKSHQLPNMKYKRKGCVAAVVRDCDCYGRPK